LPLAALISIHYFTIKNIFIYLETFLNYFLKNSELLLIKNIFIYLTIFSIIFLKSRMCSHSPEDSLGLKYIYTRCILREPFTRCSFKRS